MQNDALMHREGLKDESISKDCPANTRHLPNVAVMLGQRRRQRPNITATLGHGLLLDGFLGC